MRHYFCLLVLLIVCVSFSYDECYFVLRVEFFIYVNRRVAFIFVLIS